MIDDWQKTFAAFVESGGSKKTSISINAPDTRLFLNHMSGSQKVVVTSIPSAYTMVKPFIKRFDTDTQVASVFLFAFANEYAGVNGVNMAMFNHFMFISRPEMIGTVFNVAYCDDHRELFVSKKSLYFSPDVVKRTLSIMLPNKNRKEG